MATFDLSHLVQPHSQAVGGPIQDDEALLLYALVRVMRLRTILEIGGLDGYSARNFLKAVGGEGTVFTCDIHGAARLASNHRVITKDARLVTGDDVDGMALDLVFFDCHEHAAEMALFHSLRGADLIRDHTLLALHDTNLHPKRFFPWAYPIDGEEPGFVHQRAERQLVNDLKTLGYDAICLHTRMDRHDDSFPFRHGLTIMKKFAALGV